MASVLVGGRMNAVHVQNSTLAGGVAMVCACVCVCARARAELHLG